MQRTINHYKKFLIDEVMRSSNSNIHDAIKEVEEFSKETKFIDFFEKWKKLNTIYKKNHAQNAGDILKNKLGLE